MINNSAQQRLRRKALPVVVIRDDIGDPHSEFYSESIGLKISWYAFLSFGFAARRK
jgi:hypothetical protein